MGNKMVGGASCLEPQINRPQDKDFAFGRDPRSHWEEGRQGEGIKGICQASSIQLRPDRRQQGQQRDSRCPSEVDAAHHSYSQELTLVGKDSNMEGKKLVDAEFSPGTSPPLPSLDSQTTQNLVHAIHRHPQFPGGVISSASPTFNTSCTESSGTMVEGDHAVFES